MILDASADVGMGGGMTSTRAEKMSIGAGGATTTAGAGYGATGVSEDIAVVDVAGGA